MAQVEETGRSPDGGTGEQVREQASQVADGAQEKAREVAGQAQEKAQQAMDEGRGRLREQVDQRSTDFGQQARSTAEALRSTSEQLRGQGKEKEAMAAEKAAERTEQIGGYLEDSDGEKILRDVEDFAGRNTWAVVAGGLLAGFAASRLLKASSSRRYESNGLARGGIELQGMERGYGQAAPVGATPATPSPAELPAEPALGRS